MARWTNVKAALDGLDAILRSKQTEEEGRRYLRREKLGGTFDLRRVTFSYDPPAAPSVDIPNLTLSLIHI